MSSWYKIYGQYMVPPNPASPDLPTPTQEVYQSAMSATRAAVEGGYALPPGLGNKQAAEATLGVPGATYPHPYTMQEAAQYGAIPSRAFSSVALDSVDWSHPEALAGDILLGPRTGSQSDVKKWQRFLVRQGFGIGDYCVDGDYGDDTRRATKAVAREYLGTRVGMTADLPTQYVQKLTRDGQLTDGLWMLIGSTYTQTDVASTLTTAEKDEYCPGWKARGSSSGRRRGTSSYTPPGGVATTDTRTENGDEGLLTALSAKALTPRGGLLIGGVALLGIGAFMWFRSGPSPAPSMANRYGEDW